MGTSIILLLLFSSSTGLDRLNKKTTKAIMIRTYRRDTLAMYMYMFLLCIYFVGLFLSTKPTKYKVLTTFKRQEEQQINRLTTKKKKKKNDPQKKKKKKKKKS